MKKSQFTWLIIVVILGILYFFYSSRRPQTTITPPPVNQPAANTGSQLITPGPEPVITNNVEYYPGAIGFYVEPSKAGDYPGIIMIHEWWGLNDNIRSMAKNLATEGYRVLAVDLFGSKVAQNMQEAQNMVGTLNQSKAILNMKAAKKFISDKGSLKIASLGWCFGGGQSLQFSLSEKTLAATVIYYGQLSTDSAKLKNISWPVLGIFGDQDASIAVSTVKGFEGALDKNKTPNEIYIYPGVGHAFANPSGQNYAEKETKDAWEKTLDFLKASLK